MDPILEWGIEFIRAVQQFRSPLLDSFFLAITSLGNDEVVLLLLPIFIWCVDFYHGISIAVLAILSGYLNLAIKDWVQEPRPYIFAPGINVIDYQGYGMPSGHAQVAVTLWGSVAAWLRRRWSWAVAMTLIVLVGFSRIYLGVHFPSQVLVGWIIGAALLALYVFGHERLMAWLAGRTIKMQLALAVGIPVGLGLLHPALDNLALAGFLLGIGVGLIACTQWLEFSAGGPWWQRLLRFIVGAVVLLLVVDGLKLIFPPEGAALYAIFRALRYTLGGVWITLGGPACFRWLKLAGGGNSQK